MTFKKNFSYSVFTLGGISLVFHISDLTMYLLGNPHIGLWLGFFVVGLAAYWLNKKD